MTVLPKFIFAYTSGKLTSDLSKELETALEKAKSPVKNLDLSETVLSVEEWKKLTPHIHRIDNLETLNLRSKP